MFKYDIVLDEDESTGYSLRATESGFYIHHPNEEWPVADYDNHNEAALHYSIVTVANEKLVSLLFEIFKIRRSPVAVNSAAG